MSDSAPNAWATVIAPLLISAATLACSSSSPTSLARPVPSAGRGPAAGALANATSYLVDAGARRRALEACLSNPNNGYSRLRLAHYATGASGDWDELPKWNPATELVTLADVDESVGTSPTSLTLHAGAAPLSLQAFPDGSSVSEDDPALVALGREAFEHYPVQLAPELAVALASRDAALRYGLWLDAARGAGGLVRARMADGSAALATTCSTCHATKRANDIENGPPNASLDLGAATADSIVETRDPATLAAIAAWGPGRVDVTTLSGTEPARIADLRPVRELTYLHQDATLVARDLTTLAIRIETLIITSNGQVLRPPRIVALALAAYVRSLADDLAPLSAAVKASPRGANLFAEACASCHAPPSLTGPPIPLAVVGTDPKLGLSADRGTGFYRVSSLRGVGTRGPLFHDGTVPSLDALFDPTRPTASYASRLHGAGAVPGHLFGLDLPQGDRAALVAYLGAL